MFLYTLKRQNNAMQPKVVRQGKPIQFLVRQALNTPLFGSQKRVGNI